MVHEDFGNVITAMVTPFSEDGKLDLDGAELLANHLLKNGTDTLLLIGSTGEAAQLSPEEKELIIKRVRDYTPKNTKIIVAASDTNTMRAVAKAKRAVELGANGILVAVPEYIKPPQESLRQHFSIIADAISNTPMIIYNIPGRTGTEILPETVAQIATEHPNVIGIKQSMGNMDKVSELKALCPANFQIYSGDDSLTLPMLALGAKGVVSVASHLEGKLIQSMIRSFKNGQVEKAQELHHLLFPLYKALFMTTNPIPVKEALYVHHMIDSPKLRTLGEMSTEGKTNLHQKLAQFEINKHNYLEKKKKNAEWIKQTFGPLDRGRKYIPTK